MHILLRHFRVRTVLKNWFAVLTIAGASCAKDAPSTSEESSSTGAATATALTEPLPPTTGSATSPESDGTSDATSDSSSGELQTNTSSAGEGSSSGESSSSGTSEDPSGDSACDPWLQNCPQGQKCVPSENAETTICVPLVNDPSGAGAPCTASSASAFHGEDTCDKGLSCYFVTVDELAGTCVPMCQGSLGSPKCPEGGVCVFFGQYNALQLCLQHCNPLMDECPSGGHCSSPDWGFLCFDPNDPTANQAGDSCELTDCGKGLICVNAADVPGCPGDVCCTPYCDINGPNTCPNPGQKCVPLLDANRPMGNVGACRVP